MTDTLAIALAQINPTVGDIDGNMELVRTARTQAAAQGADLMVTGELVTSGYPPEDLVLKEAFQQHIEKAVNAFAEETGDGGPAVLLGTPWNLDETLYNAALLIDGGEITAFSLKNELPNYGVFDEMRVFEAGPRPTAVEFRGVKLGVLVCEDMWTPTPTHFLKEDGAEFYIVLNGSPYEVDKVGERLELASKRVWETERPLFYANLVGGQDELVFDGASFVLDGAGDKKAEAPSWTEGVMTVQLERGGEHGWTVADGPKQPEAEAYEQVYRALVRGLRDYVEKNGFPGVIIGLSGGIDSALSAAVAVDALGPDRVHVVMMPSPYTSQESLDDAAAAAALLGVRLDSISIEPAMQAFEAMLADTFEGEAPDITEENVQARSRGLTLMAISNKFGYMVLSTGNKSEMSVGYATLYGDMCGGYSVLKDVYKTVVFAVSRWRNEHKPDGALGPDGPVMPENIITKPPTAELKPDQTDQDTLPPYDQLDEILGCLIEGEYSIEMIADFGHNPELVRRVWKMLDRAEYKRRQAPPGVKISSRSFGRDRRYPITNGFTRLV